MTRDEMIDEMVEHEFIHVTLVEVVQWYTKLKREFMDQTFSDEEILEMYNTLFGDEEVVH
jgi:hypothetical protein